MPLRFSSFVEPLEARIAPATVLHPLPDLTAGPGQTGAVVDLSKMFDIGSTGEYANHTLVTIHTNFDADPDTPGIQGDITIELFDDVTPLTVQNFLRYALSKNESGDYDGTFFHRLAEGFVLQGGGFQTDGKSVDHIDTLPEVHNEFDPSRSNVRGTVALAKTGVGPNTGTSEWFINLNDNGGNLDSQNGGFTVFGRVIDRPGVVDGMEVVDKIAALPTLTGIVGSFPTPVQGYDSDPDHNPSTPAPALKPSNLITIADVTVEPSHGGNASGFTYQFAGAKTVVNGTVTDTNSDLLTGSINGTDLNLHYVPGKTGVAEVTVNVTKDGVTEPVTFLVKVQPNLITHIQSDGLPLAFVPGDTAKVKLDITNTGGGLAKGNVDVHFYFQKMVFDSTQQRYVAAEPSVRLDANTVESAVSIEGGKSRVLTANLKVPTSLESESGTVYQLFAEVTPKTGFNSAELYSDDNVALEGGLHQIQNQFGSFSTQQAGSREHVQLTYTEPDGDIVTFSIKGAGSGKLVQAADGSVDLQLTGTNAKTVVKASVLASSTGDGEVALRNIEALSAVGNAQLGNVDVSGNIAFTKGVKVLRLDDITGPSTMSIGVFAGAEKTPTRLSFDQVRDLSLDSTMPIASLTASEWLDTTGVHDAIVATSVKTLNITGKSGTGSAAVRGDLEANVDITSSSAVNTFRVAGLLNEATVRIYGNVGSVSLGGIVNSNFLVGANVLPDSAADFVEHRTVGSFKINGVPGVSDLFISSTVAAAQFNNILVRGVDGDSSTEKFGIVAEAIKSYNRVGGGKLSAGELKEDGPHDEVVNYQVLIV